MNENLGVSIRGYPTLIVLRLDDGVGIELSWVADICGW